MHFLRFFGMFLALFFTFVATRELDSKRGSFMTFPRTGRMDPDMVKEKWDMDAAEPHKRFFRELDTKRGSMMAFPRVGRMDPLLAKEKFDFDQFRASNFDEIPESFEKHYIENVKPLFWFANSQQKMHKRTFEDEPLPWARIIINGIPFPAKVYYNNMAEEVTNNPENKKKLSP